MLPLEVVVVLGLAAYRATRLVTSDSLTTELRARLYRWAWEDRPGSADPVARADWRTYAYELVTCPFCLGVWAAAVAVLVWRWWRDVPAVEILVALLAVAGVQALVASRPDA